jgi:hypothetical protein
VFYTRGTVTERCGAACSVQSVTTVCGHLARHTARMDVPAQVVVAFRHYVMSEWGDSGIVAGRIGRTMQCGALNMICVTLIPSRNECTIKCTGRLQKISAGTQMAPLPGI